jgi:DNA-binding response OmpR family regulator
MTILILPNSNEDFKVLRSMLAKTGQQILRSQTIHEAIKSVTNDISIDIVLVHLNVFGGKGLNFLDQIKKNPLTEFVPIAMYSDTWSHELVHQCLALGASDIVCLPTADETLLAKLRLAVKASKRTALVVDDEPLILELLKDKLEMERFCVLTADCFDGAAEILKTDHVDIVVSDIIMPGPSGMELLAHVKESYPNIPVLMITGHSGRATPEDVIKAGADGYFKKPFNNVEISFALRKALARVPAGARYQAAPDA